MAPLKDEPKIIKSLSKLGLFARVVVKKLTPEEIAQWTKKTLADSPKEWRPSPATSVCNDSSGDEKQIIRKRRRVACLQLSDSSSEGSSSDFLDSNHKKSKSRRKKTSNERRILPERSARRRAAIIYSDDSEEEDVELKIPYKNYHRGPSLNVPIVHDSSETAVASEKINGVEACLSSNKVTDVITVCSSPEDGTPRVSSSDDTPQCTAAKPLNDGNRNSSNPVKIILRSDSDSLDKITDSPSIESAFILDEHSGLRCLPSEQTSAADKPCSESVSRNERILSSPSKNIPVSQASEGISHLPGSSEENFENLDKLKKITIVNTDEKNVGKIRLRSLQSLGASDSFIREANLKTSNSGVGKIVHNLYSDHVSQIMAKSLLLKIATYLSEKLCSTEEFNRILTTIELQKSSKTEIQNEQLEKIVQKRQELDAIISKLFTQVVESFHMKLEKQNKVEYFPTLLYLGFLYILNNFIEITNNRYKKSSLFKNIVLVLTESLRNGHFKYEQIVNFFLTSNFHAHCYKLIDYIGVIKSQNTLNQLKNNGKSSQDEENSVHVPVRKISYRMVDSQMVIEYSKTLEEVETRREALKNAEIPQGDSTMTQPSIPTTSTPKSQTFTPSIPFSHQPNQQTMNQPSVIVSSSTNPIKHSPVSDAKARNPQTSSTISAGVSKLPFVTVVPRKTNENLTLHNLLASNKVPSDISVQSLASQNQPTSVIRTPQQAQAPDPPRLAPPSTTSNAATIDERVKKLSNITITATSVPEKTALPRQPGSAVKTTIASTLSPGNATFPKQPGSMVKTPITPTSVSGNAAFAKQLGSAPIQVVRPILQTKPAPANTIRPGDRVGNNSKTPEFTPRNSPPMKASLPNQPIVRTNTANSSLVRAFSKKPVAQKVNNPIRPPPPYPGNATNVGPASYQPTVSCLEQALLADSSLLNSGVPSNQLQNNLQVSKNTNSNFLPNNIVSVTKPSSVPPNCQPTNFYQPDFQNPSQYLAQNSSVLNNQTMNNNFQSSASNQNMQQYQAPQTQSFSADFGSSTINTSLLLDNNQILYNDMLNQNNSTMYYNNYVPPVATNQMQNQISGTQVYSQVTQNQSHNQLQSGAMNQFQPSVLSQPINQPMQEPNQYFSAPTPNGTVHWQNSAFSNLPMAQSFQNPLSYQNPFGQGL
nr:PREDICTED: uncharacterized protein LOC109037479 isoform X1 [Bemisia tabaci]